MGTIRTQWLYTIFHSKKLQRCNALCLCRVQPSGPSIFAAVTSLPSLQPLGLRAFNVHRPMIKELPIDRISS